MDESELTQDAWTVLLGAMLAKGCTEFDLPFEEGRTYRLSGWIKTEGTSLHGASAPVWMLEGPDKQAAVNVFDPWAWTRIITGGDTDWAYFESDFEYPDDYLSSARFIQIVAISEYSWFDDLKLQPVQD